MVFHFKKSLFLIFLTLSPSLYGATEQHIAYDKPFRSKKESSALHGINTALSLGLTALVATKIHMNYGNIQNKRVIGALFASGLISFLFFNSIAKRLIARFHRGVRYHVYNVAHTYDINIDQYRRIIQTLEKQNFENIKQRITTFYTKRFGENWQQQLQDFLTKYESFAQDLFSEKNTLWFRKQSAMSPSEYETLRMIELGAAFSEISKKKSPWIRNILAQAKTFYSLFIDLGRIDINNSR